MVGEKVGGTDGLGRGGGERQEVYGWSECRESASCD